MPTRSSSAPPRAEREGPVEHSVHRLHWADLLARTFEVDGFACPHCSSRMTLRAIVLPGLSALDITAALQDAAARAPPQVDRGPLTSPTPCGTPRLELLLWEGEEQRRRKSAG